MGVMRARSGTACALLLAASVTSCATMPYLNGEFATVSLWAAADPNATQRIPQSATSEAELRRHGRTFYRDDDKGVYWVEKNRSDKAMDYTARTIGTPLAVVSD